MEKLIIELRRLRKQLVSQQSIVNESIALVDVLMDYLIEGGNVKANLVKEIKRFPSNLTSKRDKLKYILKLAGRPLSAKEVKAEIVEYGDKLENVDQSLVNLEKASMISSKINDGRKYYFIKK